MLQKIKIGNVLLKNNLFLAPLAGITDLVFRELMVQHGVGLVFSEMISAAGLSRRDAKTFHLLAISKKEKPIAVQLFGNKPEEFSRSVEIINAEIPADIIDINMGCPVKKVVQSGSGSALMKQLDQARQIIQATVNKAAVPVTVKFRTGWDDKSLNFIELGKLCEQEGVTAVTLHARTRKQAYAGQADWTKIKELKQALKIPVIGSGDIKTLADAQRMFAVTGCDALMIGRAAIGNPWLIESIIRGKEIVPTPQQRINMYLTHVQTYLKKFSYLKEVKAICEMRKFAHRYITGFSGAAKVRQEINKIKDYQTLKKLLESELIF